MAEQPARQAGDKGMRRDHGALAERLTREIVHLRRARAVARKVKRYQPGRSRLGADGVAGQVEVLGDAAAPRRAPRPVLAQQRALMR